MVKFLQASLTVLVSIAIAALVTVVVVPDHARGVAADREAVSDIRHAVLVEHLAPPSGPASTASTCPSLTRPGAGSPCPYVDGVASQVGRVPLGARELKVENPPACPYLSTLAARSGCPALTTRTETSACPFLSGRDDPDASPQVNDDHEAPRALWL